MEEINCPTCGHPVSQHTEFYCMHINCFCSLSKDAAEARYWAIEYYNAYTSLSYALMRKANIVGNFTRLTDEQQ